MPLTFKNLQDKVLGWLDETDDSEVVLENVKEAIAAANAERAGSREWPWMISTATGTLSSGVYTYNLATDVNTLLSVHNSTQNVPLTQVPYRHYLQEETVVNGFVRVGQTITLLFEPRAGDVITYKYYRHPVELSADGDTPDIPYPFSRILIYDALLDLANYSEDITPAKVDRWEKKQQALELGLLAANLDGDSLHAFTSQVNETETYADAD